MQCVVVIMVTMRWYGLQTSAELKEHIKAKTKAKRKHSLKLAMLNVKCPNSKP